MKHTPAGDAAESIDPGDPQRLHHVLGRFATGVPLLAGACASFVCQTVSQQDAGDHRLFIGQVLHATDRHLPPLLFQGGRYRRLGVVL